MLFLRDRLRTEKEICAILTVVLKRRFGLTIEFFETDRSFTRVATVYSK